MTLSSNYLEAFYACAQMGHFTKAAEKIGITQSAISQRILNLESQLQTSLFIRDRAGIRLTDAGQILMRFCKTQKNLHDEVLVQLSGVEDGLSGFLRIGGYSSIMRSAILPVLAPLLRENQNLKICFVNAEMNELPSLLKSGEIDYMILHNQWHGEHLTSIKLGEEKNVMIESINFKSNIYLDHDENDQVTLEYLKMIGKSSDIERRFLDDVYGIIDGVRLGIGRAVIPLHLVRQDTDIRVINKKQLVSPIILHFHTQPYYSKLHDAVVQLLKKEVKRYL